MTIYTIEYYTTHPKTGWTETQHDYVMAKDSAEALKKFRTVHPDISTATIVNWLKANY